MSLYTFVVEFYDAIENQPNAVERGFLFAESYAEASNSLTSYFGEDEIDSISLTYVNDSNILFVDDEAVVEKIRMKGENCI